MTEIKLHYREYFESLLAIKLAQSPHLFPSIKKISSRLLMLLKQHQEKAILQIKENQKIREELYQKKYYGHFDNNFSDPLLIYDQIMLTLTEPTNNIPQVMQIHAIFIHRIYDYLSIDLAQKYFYCQNLFPQKLFSNRARLELPINLNITTKPGINKNKVWENRLKETTTEHIPAKNRFIPDCSSNFFKETQQKNIPFIAGPSGHTGSLLLGALLYGNLTEEELQEYAIACFAFLASGGNHSFHEVMTVAKLVGVKYQVGQYAPSFTENLKGSEVYKDLLNQFPEFLEEPKELKFISN